MIIIYLHQFACICVSRLKVKKCVVVGNSHIKGSNITKNKQISFSMLQFYKQSRDGIKALIPKQTNTESVYERLEQAYNSTYNSTSNSTSKLNRKLTPNQI